ncbi:hypothetical protein [Ferruginibacter sp.]
MTIRLLISFLTFFTLNSIGQTKDSISIKYKDFILDRDTTIRNKLLKFDLNNFIGKRVNDLLSNETIAEYDTYWFSDEPPFKLNCLYLKYANGLYLKVFASSLRYQPRYSKERKFNFELYKKEKISKIVLDRKWFELNIAKKNP